MSSRQEEKERRRQERLAAEQAAARALARRRRLQVAFGGVLVAALVAGGVALALAGFGGDDGSGGPRQASEVSGVTLPEPQTADLGQAAKAAGCTLVNAKLEGDTHETREFTAKDYGTNPPTSGTHHPQPAQDGIYEPGNAAPLGQIVHALEHGRIEVQYKPGTSADTIRKLEAFVGENGGYHMLMFENTTNMPFEVAATAWTHQLGCPKMNDKVFDALRTFRDRYIDKGPETAA